MEKIQQLFYSIHKVPILRCTLGICGHRDACNVHWPHGSMSTETGITDNSVILLFYSSAKSQRNKTFGSIHRLDCFKGKLMLNINVVEYASGNNIDLFISKSNPPSNTKNTI